jgi:hypothetical protein
MARCPEMAGATVVDGDGATGRIAGELPRVGVAACAGGGSGVRGWRGAGVPGYFVGGARGGWGV